ncbi:hypothetical protein N2152v2_008795 [Parachlorella kessleri]
MVLDEGNLPAAPFHLLRVRPGPGRSIEDWANEGFLGLRLADLVRGEMKWALVSNYMVDLRWLLSACPDLARAQRLILVHGEGGSTRAQQIEADVDAAGLRARTTVHAPPITNAYGVHHSKAFLLQYAAGLRVVVHTANMIYSDCNNKSQGVWWQDFPLKDGQSPQTSEFEEHLTQYLRELRLPPSVSIAARAVVSLHDFSAARAHLVGSVPGWHKGGMLSRWGHMRVRACLGREAFPSHFAGAPLVAQFSSLGGLDEGWVTAEFTGSLSAGKRQPLPRPAAGPAGLQLVWPTEVEVRDSLEGWFAGGSIPGRADKVTRPFLQAFWHRWGGEAGGRQHAMPHIKTYLRYQIGAEGGASEVAWLLLSSHNLSKAAWGALKKDDTVLHILHFELGVLLLPGLEAAYLASRHCGFTCTPDHPVVAAAAAIGQGSGSPGAPAAPESVRFVAWQRGQPQEASSSPASAGGSSTLTVPLPIPYALPPHKYRAGDSPWATDLPHKGLDSRGYPAGDTRKIHYGLLEEWEWGEWEFVLEGAGGTGRWQQIYSDTAR